MITIYKINSDGLYRAAGLAADIPDLPKLNGAKFFAIDENKTYFYDADGDSWEGYTGDPEDHDELIDFQTH